MHGDDDSQGYNSMPLKRVANSAFANLGRHATIVKIVNSPDQCYGFAMTDAGEDLYIPGTLVKRFALSDMDEGAGFTSLVRNSPPDVTQHSGNKSVAQLMVMPPFKLDDQNPIFVSGSDESDDPDATIQAMDEEIAELLDQHEKMTDTLPQLDQTIEAMRLTLTKMRTLLSLPMDQILRAQREVVTALEQAEAKACEMHNTMTEGLEWREKTYPDTEAETTVAA
jgi:hypothetical protein